MDERHGKGSSDDASRAVEFLLERGSAPRTDDGETGTGRSTYSIAARLRKEGVAYDREGPQFGLRAFGASVVLDDVLNFAVCALGGSLWNAQDIFINYDRHLEACDPANLPAGSVRPFARDWLKGIVVFPL